MISVNMPISINCEVLPDQEQPGADPSQQEQPGAGPNQQEQPQQPLLAELPFQMDAEIVPEEEELYQRFYQRLSAELYQSFYQRLAADLAEELACSCEGCHDD